jgi:hypothetical protein
MITDGFFYTEFKKRHTNFDQETFACAERTVEKLLTRTSSDDHPGMLLGKVQSGKTRTFVSILALSFDNGYDIAIVFTKNSLALAMQTVTRLSTDLDFSESGEDDELVEIKDIMLCREEFTEYEIQEKKLIFVVKKQRYNLERIMKLMNDHPMMKEKRIIFVDDEADNASIGFRKKDDLLEAKTIADLISQVRATVPNSSFLQVTATPYSLYLQPVSIDVSNNAEFKPVRPAFTELVHVPEGYVGGNVYFADVFPEDDSLAQYIHCTLSDEEIELVGIKKGKRFNWDEALTSPRVPGIRLALANFIVGGIMLNYNSAPRKKKFSFVLHVEIAKEKHAGQARIVKKIFSKFKESADNDNGSGEFSELFTNAYNDIGQSLTVAGLKVPDLAEVLQKSKEVLGKEISIAVINSDNAVIKLLDDKGQLRLTNPFNIFIGGNVLDRGITLANLTGFYYGRDPKRSQQDTVLQHARMYGYRMAELPVTRFYTTATIRDRLKKMEEFDSALRQAIENDPNAAIQFIQKSADGKIIPCSPNKIAASQTDTLKSGKRILPYGFQTYTATGEHGISKTIQEMDTWIEKKCGFNTDQPTKIPYADVVDFLNKLQKTIYYPDESKGVEFDWPSAYAILNHLCTSNPANALRRDVWVWAAKDRNITRKRDMGTVQERFSDHPESKTENDVYSSVTQDAPFLFLLRQNGEKSQGWSGTPFYWPVIRVQKEIPTAIYTPIECDPSEIVDEEEDADEEETILAVPETAQSGMTDKLSAYLDASVQLEPFGNFLESGKNAIS